MSATFTVKVPARDVTVSLGAVSVTVKLPEFTVEVPLSALSAALATYTTTAGPLA